MAPKSSGKQRHLRALGAAPSPPQQQQLLQRHQQQLQLQRRDSGNMALAAVIDMHRNGGDTRGVATGLGVDKGVFGTPLFPILVHYIVCYFVLIVLKIGMLATKINLVHSLLYWVVAYVTLQVSRIVYYHNPLSMQPLLMTFAPFAVLLIVSREAHNYVAAIWFMFLLLSNLRLRMDGHGHGRRFGSITVIYALVLLASVAFISVYYVAEPDNLNPLIGEKLDWEAVNYTTSFVTIVLGLFIAFAFYMLEVNSFLMRRDEFDRWKAHSDAWKEHNKANGIVEVADPRLQLLQRSDSLNRFILPFGRQINFNNHQPPEPAVVKSPAKASRTTDNLTLPRFEIDYDELEIKDFIGKGASGSVFLGVFNGRRVAVKKLITNTSILEAELLSQLSHRHVVQFFGACTDPANLCIVIEYAEKGCLYDVLHDKSFHISPELTMMWARQVASGMDYLHNGAPKQIVHRDLKSNNILVCNNHDLKITDFGVSRELDHATQITVAGTYAWMAPEIIRNEACNEKVDVWSYGVVVWELLTREIPFAGMEPFAIAFKVGNNTLKLPTSLKGLPAFFRLLMEQCFETNPKSRPSFSDVLKILGDVQNDFTHQGGDEYMKRQQAWSTKIAQFVEEEKTNVLSNKEKELNAREQKLKQRELDVRRRENQMIKKGNKPIIGQIVSRPPSTGPGAGPAALLGSPVTPRF